MRYWLLIIFLTLSASLPAQINMDSLDRAIRDMPYGPKRLNAIKDEIQRHFQSQPDEAVRYAYWYAEEAAEMGDPIWQARGSNFLGIATFSAGDIPGSIEHYLAAYRSFEKARDSLAMGITLNNLAAAYEIRNKTAETLKYYQAALDIFQAVDNQEWIAICENNLANQYMEEDPARALAAYQRSYEIHQNLGIAGRDGAFLMNMGNCYLDLGEYDQAIAMHEAAIPHLEEIHDMHGLSNAHHSLGIAYFDQNKLDQAETHLQIGWDLAEGILQRQVDLASSLSELYKARGAYQTALLWRDRHMQLQDSLFDQEKDEQMTKMMAEFEAEKKDQEIRLLTAEKELGERRILMLGGGSILLGIIALLIAFFWRTNQRQNRLLSQKNADLAQALDEKESLMREIHHRVKNNLQVISSLLRLQGRRLQDSGAKTAIEASQARLEAISLIHQFLYRDTEVTQVDLKAYLEELLTQLERLYQDTVGELETSRDIDTVDLDIDSVLPISLIVNELLTNAFKYAPQSGQAARIHLGLKRETEGLRLTVADNGPGYDAGAHRADSLGLRLVRTFVDRLSGTLDIQAQPGTTIQIFMPWTALAS
ncbi:MAG: hypothetical protein D6722_17395 [Bacteroidetes bacterium]|nr:MAG: hypothetical protein D6722_17395 [Bacteroidota bacterium]